VTFPQHFLFGSATAAYQIEGAVSDDGRGVSIWDTFSHAPGRTRNGDTGDIAADHYHRLVPDLDLMAGLGLQAYRFSIAWPRIVPDGRGAVNQAGLDFYSRLVDGLLERGIAPFATLYHWDLPQPLEDRGGWTSRGTADAFAHYAEAVGEALGDRVHTWITLNEPRAAAFHGYGDGGHAPGRTSRLEPLQAAHHLNLAHGLAIQALRPLVAPTAQFCVALDLQVFRPEGPTGQTARDKVEAISRDTFLGPMLEGAYSDRLIELTRPITDWSFVHDGDLDITNQPLDALGVNYYHSNTVRLRDNNQHSDDTATAWPGAEDVEFLPPTGPLTDMGWNIDPAGLRDLLADMHHRFPGLPLLVTENGAAFPDTMSDGAVHDQQRIDYVHRHLAATEQAIADGVDVRGYFLWSLMDNFEWAEGYSKRFGIVHVDYDSQHRILKDSAHWYSKTIRSRRLPSPATS
jgi:beta-glucosidase